MKKLLLVVLIIVCLSLVTACSYNVEQKTGEELTDSENTDVAQPADADNNVDANLVPPAFPEGG